MDNFRYSVKETRNSRVIASSMFPKNMKSLYTLAAGISKVLTDPETCYVDSRGTIVIVTNQAVSDSDLVALHKRIQSIIY